MAGRGGTFHVDALQANGPGNFVDTKCDLTIKKDAGGTVMIRWLPSWNYADFSGSRQFAGAAGLNAPGFAGGYSRRRTTAR
jgi:hypothetical protein